MKKIKDLFNLVMNWLFSVVIYLLYHLLYPIGFVLMCFVIYHVVNYIPYMWDTGLSRPDDIKALKKVIGAGILFVLNYYILKFIQEFTLMFNETIRSKMNNEYNINEFTPEEQEDILAQFTPEERKYIEEQMELEDREVKITIHDEYEENSDE